MPQRKNVPLWRDTGTAAIGEEIPYDGGADHVRVYSAEAHLSTGGSILTVASRYMEQWYVATEYSEDIYSKLSKGHTLRATASFVDVGYPVLAAWVRLKEGLRGAYVAAHSAACLMFEDQLKLAVANENCVDLKALMAMRAACRHDFFLHTTCVEGDMESQEGILMRTQRMLIDSCEVMTPEIAKAITAISEKLLLTKELVALRDKVESLTT